LLSGLDLRVWRQTYHLKKKDIDENTYDTSPYTGVKARGYLTNGDLIVMGAQLAQPLYATTVPIMHELSTRR